MEAGSNQRLVRTIAMNYPMIVEVRQPTGSTGELCSTCKQILYQQRGGLMKRLERLAQTYQLDAIRIWVG